jgi:hypothetical protein
LIAGGSVFLFGIYAGPIVASVIEASRSGGNLLEAALIAGASMGLGMAAGMAVGAIAKPGMQGFLNVLSSGVVGGLVSSGMGGDFWQGFIGAGVAAGVSFAGMAIVNGIEESSDVRTGSGFEGPSSDETQTEVTPTKHLPDASTLPKGHRIAYLLEGDEFNGKGDIRAGATQAAADAQAKGYIVVPEHIGSNTDFDKFLKDYDIKGQTVIVRAHHDLLYGGNNTGFFDWSAKFSQALGTNDSHVAASLAGARRVIYLECNTESVASLTSRLASGATSAWGSSGFMNTVYQGPYMDKGHVWSPYTEFYSSRFFIAGGSGQWY